MLGELKPYNRAVVDSLRFHLQSPAPTEFVEQIHEFDDCRYQLQGYADGSIVLSFGLPTLDDCYTQQLLNTRTQSALKTVYSEVAEMIQPQPGYQVSMKLDTMTLRRTHRQEWWIEALASVRLYVTGAPLRELFLHLASATLRSGPVVQLCNRPGQVYFVKPHDDSVTVILPIRFVSSQDAALGHAILQEFAEARRAGTLGPAPTCTYHTAKNPPLEVQGVSPELLGSGYICFTFYQRHVTGHQLEHMVWSMTTLYALISYHIKACKAMLHGKMRSKLDAMLCVMPQTAPTPLPALKPLHSTYLPSNPSAAPQARPQADAQGYPQPINNTAATATPQQPHMRDTPVSQNHIDQLVGQLSKAAISNNRPQVPDTQAVSDRTQQPPGRGIT